jgi:hypothetical protein
MTGRGDTIPDGRGTWPILVLAVEMPIIHEDRVRERFLNYFEKSY